MRNENTRAVDDIDISRLTNRNSRHRPQYITHIYFRRDETENVSGASLKQPGLNGRDALNISTRFRDDHRHCNRHHRFSRGRKIYGAEIFDTIPKGGELKLIAVTLVGKLLCFKHFLRRQFNYFLPASVKKANFLQITILSKHERHVELGGRNIHSDK